MINWAEIERHVRAGDARRTSALVGSTYALDRLLEAQTGLKRRLRPRSTE
jgi:hypothetical protein